MTYKGLYAIKQRNLTNQIISVYLWWRPCGVVVNVLDFDTVVNKFELQSRYKVHFWTNALGKGMNRRIPQL